MPHQRHCWRVDTYRKVPQRELCNRNPSTWGICIIWVHKKSRPPGGDKVECQSWLLSPCFANLKDLRVIFAMSAMEQTDTIVIWKKIPIMSSKMQDGGESTNRARSPLKVRMTDTGRTTSIPSSMSNPNWRRIQLWQSFWRRWFSSTWGMRIEKWQSFHWKALLMLYWSHKEPSCYYNQQIQWNWLELRWSLYHWCL